jgi:hypothetical protein
MKQVRGAESVTFTLCGNTVIKSASARHFGKHSLEQTPCVGMTSIKIYFCVLCEILQSNQTVFLFVIL